LKRKILAIIAGIAIIGVTCFQVIPAFAQSTNSLDHVVITPVSTTLPVSGIQLFSAQAYDSENQALSGITYHWMVISGGGMIDTSGLFTAGNIPGTYINTVTVFAVQGTNVKIATANVTVTAALLGDFHHVKVTPVTTTLVPGSTQQFTAQACDENNVAITGFTYTWYVVNGGGSFSVSKSGLFTADTIIGEYVDTVQVVATNGSINGVGKATVVVKQDVTPTPTPRVDRNRLMGMFNCYLKNFGFDDFLGGQWQVKDDGVVKTIKVVPGIVQATPAPSTTSITIKPNGQETPITFTLTSDTVIQPKNIIFTADDRVVVVTVNDQVVLVMKAAPADAERLPPGLRKHGDDKRFGKDTPPGWSKGLKNGWWQWFGGNKNNNSKNK
jgi:hypothetical protein